MDTDQLTAAVQREFPTFDVRPVVSGGVVVTGDIGDSESTDVEDVTKVVEFIEGQGFEARTTMGVVSFVVEVVPGSDELVASS